MKMNSNLSRFLNVLLFVLLKVNRHIEATESDTWFNVLPLFHVGGLSILVRAFLSGASVVNGRIKSGV